MAKVRLALLARVEAKAGKEAEVENFLRSALTIVDDEPETLEWFAIKMGPSTFGIFDVFKDEAGRQAHLNGRGDGFDGKCGNIAGQGSGD